MAQRCSYCGKTEKQHKGKACIDPGLQNLIGGRRVNLGSAPIEPKYKAMMNDVAAAIDKFFNGDAQGTLRKTGFVLLVFPFGEQEGRCNYISNGADRRDIVKLLREQANRMDEGTQ